MTNELSLILARIFLIAGLGVGLLSWRETIGHIGNPNFLMPNYQLAPTHGWYHFFREACGDVAKMIVLLLIFFGPVSWRTPIMWWLCLILMCGYYAPFWIGKPFLPALAAPNRTAEIIHMAMTVPSFLALILSWPSFHLLVPPPSRW